MRNLHDQPCRDELLARLGRLTAEHRALWGRMNVSQMVCHLADPMRIALGELEAADVSNVLTRTLLRGLVMAGVPAPKGKVETFPEIDQVAGGGTAPTDLASDIDELRAAIVRFVAHASAGRPFAPSPTFGRLSGRAYGRLMAVHMDHHLRQFGV